MCVCKVQGSNLHFPEQPRSITFPNKTHSSRHSFVTSNRSVQSFDNASCSLGAVLGWLPLVGDHSKSYPSYTVIFAKKSSNIRNNKPSKLRTSRDIFGSTRITFLSLLKTAYTDCTVQSNRGQWGSDPVTLNPRTSVSTIRRKHPFIQHLIASTRVPRKTHRQSARQSGPNRTRLASPIGQSCAGRTVH